MSAGMRATVAFRRLQPSSSTACWSSTPVTGTDHAAGLVDRSGPTVSRVTLALSRRAAVMAALRASSALVEPSIATSRRWSSSSPSGAVDSGVVATLMA